MIEAFNRLGLAPPSPGRGGPQRLEALAGPNVTFLGYVRRGSAGPDGRPRIRWPGEEDFGIAPIQAMAAGRPVIAYAAGGALDTVVPGAGALFADQTPEAMIEAIETFDDARIDPAFIRAHAAQFDSAIFRQRLLDFVEQAMERHRRAAVT